MKNILTVRPAAESDIPAIFQLLEYYAARKIVLARSREDIHFFLGNFVVAELDGTVRGCGAVRDFGSDLLEVRSLVVEPGFQGKGIGRTMIESTIAGLKANRPAWRLFTLTCRQEFFQRLGFRKVEKDLFPEKIWSDCSKCAKFTCCDEIAMLFCWPPQPEKEF